MSKTPPETGSAEGAERNAGGFSPLVIAAWAVPGLGHLLLGKTRRAAIFAGVILAAFTTGLLVGGELAMPRAGQPFSWLAAAACLGSGLPYFLAKILGFGTGDPGSLGFSYGNTFLYTAGLMNLLTMLDVSDIVRGEKQ